MSGWLCNNWENLVRGEKIDVLHANGSMRNENVKVHDSGDSYLVYTDTDWPSWERITVHRADGWQVIRYGHPK